LFDGLHHYQIRCWYTLEIFIAVIGYYSSFNCNITKGNPTLSHEIPTPISVLNKKLESEANKTKTQDGLIQ